MAILKTYPLKSNYYGSDRIILSDMEPDSEGIVHGNTKNITMSNLKTFVGSQVIDVSASTENRYKGAFVSPTTGNVKVGINLLPLTMSLAPNGFDYLLITDDPSGNPINKKTTVDNFFSSAGLITNSSINYTVKLPSTVGSASQVLQLPSVIGSSPHQLEWSTIAGSGTVNGSGTAGKISKWLDSNTLTDSSIFEDSVTGNIGIGTAIPDSILTVKAATANVGLPVIKASVSGFANGYTLIGDNYTAGESQLNLGISYPTSNGVLSRGVKVSSTANNVFLSSQDQYSLYSQAFVLQSDGSFRFLNTSTSANTPVDTAVSLSERMRITKDGDVGIGTTSPDGLLHVSAGTQGDARLILEADTDNNDENDVPQIWFKADGGTTEGLIGLNNNFLDIMSNSSILNGIRFFTGSTSNIGTTDPYTGATEKMRIMPNGNVGIGNTNPTQKLDVTGKTRSKGLIIYSTGGVNAGDTTVVFDNTLATKQFSIGSGIVSNTESGLAIRNVTDSRTDFYIDDTGDVGIGTTAPAAKLDILDTVDQTAIRVTNNNYNNYLIQKRRTDDTQKLGIKEFGSNGGLALVTAGTERLNINNLGNVGIGITNPTQKLEVLGNLKLKYPTSLGTFTLEPNASNNSQYSLILPTIPSSNDGSKFLQLPSSTTGLQQFQLEWADPRLQVATNINKTRSLNPGSGISMTSTDNGLNVTISSTGGGGSGPGTGTLNAFPYWNTTSSLGSSQLTRLNGNQLEITQGSLVISNGAISLKTGSGPTVTLGSPITAGTNYMIRLPELPTVAAGYTGGMGLKLPDTLGSSPFQLEWQQPNTKFKDVNSRPFIDGNLSGGISMQQGTGPAIKLEATGIGGPATTYLLPPASQSQAGYVLTLPTGTITSPYQLAWTNASSVTSTNNVTASANSLNLQGSSSVAPTYGAPLNISSSGGSGSGAQTAIYIDQAATANPSGSQGIRMNFKTASVGILVTNADSQFSNVANFRNSSNQVVGTISCTSIATTYATSSDYRIKENVVDMTGAVDRVKQLKPSRFNFTADPSKTVDGFLAHEAQEVVPESVIGVKDALYSNGDPLLQGIDQSKIVPLLTGAIKELIARIEVLEAK